MNGTMTLVNDAFVRMTEGREIPRGARTLRGPHPQGRDCGKWLHPQRFAEGPFGLWQIVETGRLCLGVLAGDPGGYPGLVGFATWALSSLGNRKRPPEGSLFLFLLYKFTISD